MQKITNKSRCTDLEELLAVSDRSLKIQTQLIIKLVLLSQKSIKTCPTGFSVKIPLRAKENKELWIESVSLT